ncbi:MAG: RnfH family protein, partial [Romboutsia sp.]|nr:RnfH family protein [Romboutsia sp.]
ENNNALSCEVAYASASLQIIQLVTFKAGDLVKDVLINSKVLEKLLLEPISRDINYLKVGIFNKRVSLEDRVSAGDRIEIYRDLLTDPKSARRRRVVEHKKR